MNETHNLTFESTLSSDSFQFFRKIQDHRFQHEEIKENNETFFEEIECAFNR